MAVPAMREFKASNPESELHVLVAEDALPLVKHMPWITRVWGFPRKRGKSELARTLPVLASLRKQNFDQSVDFVGNDRGALVSRMVGAKKRVGLITHLGFVGRRLCYTDRVLEESLPALGIHEAERHAHLLHRSLGVALPESIELELHADPSLTAAAAAIVPDRPIMAHLSTSQVKKEWPLVSWVALHRLAKAAGIPFVMASGPSLREQALLDSVLAIDPSVRVIRSTPTLDLYLAVIARARAFVSGDTGPLHFAAGLGVPSIGLFAATDGVRWAPRGKKNLFLSGNKCSCSGHSHVCGAMVSCMSSIPVEDVWRAVKSLVEPI